MLRTPTALQQAAEQLLGCVCAALEDTAAQYPTIAGLGCPCVVCVHPGQPAYDACCDCLPGGQVGGQLNVWVERIYPTTQFPDQVTQSHRCLPAGTGVAADLVVTLLRCAPTVDDNGLPPSCAQLEATAQVVHLDMLAVFSAATCCFPTASGRRRARKVLVREHRTIEPQGGCTGSELRITADLGAPCLCPAGES